MSFGRSDISNNLIHLIRHKSMKDALGVLISIMEERKLEGGTGYIIGKHRCICFTEAPLSLLPN